VPKEDKNTRTMSYLTEWEKIKRSFKKHGGEYKLYAL
jgi:hypothetical protein